MSGEAASEDPWKERAKNVLKAELRRRGFTYSRLVDELAKLSVEETERNIANKLSRGTFSAAFLMQCLAAIGASRIDLGE